MCKLNLTITAEVVKFHYVNQISKLKAMLTIEDIKNIVTARKEVFYTREEMDVKFDALNENFSSLQTSVVGMAKDTKDQTEEMIILGSRVKNTEDFLQSAAPKLGLEFKR